jgi:hypothetical protein
VDQHAVDHHDAGRGRGDLEELRKPHLPAGADDSHVEVADLAWPRGRGRGRYLDVGHASLGLHERVQIEDHEDTSLLLMTLGWLLMTHPFRLYPRTFGP